MTEILMIWQPSQQLNGVQGRPGLPTFCISAMILLAQKLLVGENPEKPQVIVLNNPVFIKGV